MSDRPWNPAGKAGEFQPYVPATQSVTEFSLRAVVLGGLFGLLFGAVSVYVGLRAGLTVSASIPISVLSISILRAFGRSTILENNIVQTTGSAGESLAAGVMFTLPALIFLGFGSEFTFWRIFPLALLGGWLGVLFMIPLRRQLIVKEHGNLTFPEGTACADVLVAGERGGSFAGRVFWGLGLGGVYTFLMNTVQAWTGQPEARPSWFPGASLRAAVTSEYLGVGYIIGPRVAGILFAGGIVSWLVIMPAIKFYGQLAGNTPIYPSTIPIPQMSPDDLWRSYIRPMGAGAVAAAGLITLLRTLPTIFSALAAGLKDVQAGSGQDPESSGRTQRDVPMKWVVVGSAVIVVMMWILLTFHPMKGAQTAWYQNLFAGVFVVVFGFLFVTVASRISGLLGNSSNPISGMSIATLMATCAIFFLAGWTAPNYSVLALMIGGVVCIAAAIAGATSQDLKTGFLVGATPFWQQMGLLVGVTISTVAIGATLNLMNKGLERYIPTEIAVNLQALPSGVKVERPNFTYQGKNYELINVLGSHEIADGEYLVRRHDEPDRIPVGARDRRRQGAGSASAADGNGDQRDIEPAIAVAAGADGRGDGDCGGDIGREVAGVRDRDVPFDCDDGGDVRGRPGSLGRGCELERKKRGGQRSKPRRAVFERIDRGGGNIWTAGDRHQSSARPGDFDARARMGGVDAAVAVAGGPVRGGAKDHGRVGDK